MGRPPLNRQAATITTAVRITTDIRDRIEAVAGPNRMAAFIREAIENELQRWESAGKPKD